MSRIAESLRHLTVPASSIRPHPDNPRRGDPDRIAESLSRFGQVRPLVVQDSTGLIVAGNHTWLAAVDRLGWTEIAAARVDLDDDEARAYLLADNRLADIAVYDDEALAAVLEQLGDLAFDSTGWGRDDYDDLLERLADEAEPDPEPEPRRPPDTSMREVVLLLTAEQFGQFERWVRDLRVRYGPNELRDLHGADGSVATVFEAVRREYARGDE